MRSTPPFFEGKRWFPYIQMDTDMTQQGCSAQEDSLNATLSPPVHLFRQDGLLCFIQAFAAGLGFAMSAGWDWLPPMHGVWSGEFVGSFLGEDKELLSTFVPSKLLMLLVSGVLLERMILFFLVRRCGSLHNPFLVRRRPFSGPVLISPQMDERVALLFPFILIQIMGICLLSVLTFLLPPESGRPCAWILATVSTWFGLVWILFILLLPRLWSCVGYCIALGCSVGVSVLVNSLPDDSLPILRLFFPAAALSLIFFAAPPSDEIKERIGHYRKWRFARRTRLSFPLWERLCRLLRGHELFSGWRIEIAGLVLFGVMCGARQLLDFSYGCPVICAGMIPERVHEHAPLLMLGGEASGALLAVLSLRFWGGHLLLTPLLGLSLFGVASLMTTIFADPPLNTFSVFLLHLSSGCCAAFGIYFFHRFFLRHHSLFAMLSRGLFLLCLFGTYGGALLWSIAEGIKSSVLSNRVLYMHMLALAAFVTMFVLYMFRESIWIFLCDEPGTAEKEEEAAPEVVQEQPPASSVPLTPREREVLELVRTGMKNLEISSHLNISEATLRVHLRRIYRKLQIQGRSNLREAHPDA